jgi:hypothetical protein
MAYGKLQIAIHDMPYAICHTRHAICEGFKMDNPLAPWRDLSVVWLVLLTMIFVAVPGIVFYFAQLYLRRLNRWLRLPLLTAQVWALRIEQGSARVSERIASVPIGLHSASANIRVTTRGVVDFLQGK